MEFDPLRTSTAPETAGRVPGAATSATTLLDPGRTYPLPEYPGPETVSVSAALPAAWPEAVRRPLRRLAATSAKLVFVFALLWGFLFNFSEVRGSSMEPGIHDRDRILVDHLSYLFTDVHRGDVVVLRYPLDPSLDYIKRVVGLPGDEITIRGQEVWVNGELSEEPYVADELVDPYTYMTTIVKPGHVFVLGDNRLRSSDSREFGQVETRLLRGKVRFRLWPLGRAGLVQ